MKTSPDRHCKKWEDHLFELQVTTETYRCANCTFTVNGAWFENLNPKDKNVRGN